MPDCFETTPNCLAAILFTVLPSTLLRIIVALPQPDASFSDHDWDRFSRATFAGGRFNLPNADLWTFRLQDSVEVRRLLPEGLHVGETCRISYADALSLVDSLNLFQNSSVLATQREE